MKNNQLFPFERNRYFAGKMLTSSDFQAEQTYFNNKRRFINSLLYGSGIVCGCNVFSLDDLSILVESGVAIDDFGREIIIQSSAVKKLSAMEGFEDIKGEEVLLCMRYAETPLHSVFAVNCQGKEDSYEYNRISEGYELFLKEMPRKENFELESEFFLKASLYENEDFRVEIMMPATVCKGVLTRIRVKVTRLSEHTEPISWNGVVQMPAFLSEDGSHELKLEFEMLYLGKGQSEEKDYWVEAGKTEEDETTLVFRDEKGNRSFKVQLRDTSPDELVDEEIGKVSLEMMGLEEKKDYIPLALLKLLRTDSAYIIDEIRERGIKEYINAPGQFDKRRQYEDYFLKKDYSGHKGREDQAETKEELPEYEEKPNVPAVATGIVEIPLGADAQKGDVVYSGEIMHGLGRGNVYVELGYECYDADSVYGANSKSTIYGKADLFEDETGAEDVETAVKVLNDKGSFIVAAKLLKKVENLVLTYRWSAVLFPSGEENWKEDYENKSITAETPTVVLGMRESYYFNVKFNNMEKCSVTYELTEGGSGEITADGVYTAPRKDGVYEIRIYCTDMPVICTYAYAIVRGKKGEEKE